MIYLYGDLAKKYGKEHCPKVKSAVEAVQAMEANNSGFRNDIKMDKYYSIVRGKDLNSGKSVAEDELNLQFNVNDWHIIPIVEGAKDSGFLQIILGAALIAAAFFIPGMSPIVMKIGVSLMLGGVAQLLAPGVDSNYNTREPPEERASYLFDGPTNRTEQGHPIPIAYGETYIGSIVVSAGIDVGETA